jgi:CMP-N,N'-diacetyllegionaminic acid synthase
MKKKTIAIIPARSGSKSIKDKNLLVLGGKNLIQLSIEACKKSKKIDQIIFTSDSQKYINLAKNYGADILIKRPLSISKDTSADIDFIKNAINQISYIEFDFIAHIRPTTPIRDYKILDKAIKEFSKLKFDSLRSIHEMSETAYKCHEIKQKTLVTLKNLNITLDDSNHPRQKFPKTYVANGLIDIYKKNFILKNNMLFGKKVMPFITKKIYEIDCIEDYIFLKRYIVK